MRCSGVDALYLPGGAELSEDLFALLEARYRLAHPSGLLGVTPSDKLPSFYVQPYDRPSRTSTTTPKPSPPTPSNRPNLPPGSKVLKVLDEVRLPEPRPYATEAERRTLLDELVESVTVHPDRLTVHLHGAPPLNVAFSEAGLKDSELSGVGGGT